MIKLFFCSLLVGLMAQSAFALEPKNPVSVCSRLNPDYYKSACYTVINRYEYIDHLAAAVCDRYTSSELTVTCMQTIADRRFESAGLLECNRYPDPENTNDCLNVIADRYLQPDALKACARITSPSVTTSCLRAIAGKRIAPYYVQQCDSYASGWDTVYCFERH